MTPTYDDNGNLTEDATQKYTYDAWNRLVNVTTREDAVTIAAYTYGPTGRRIKKVVSNSGDRDATWYYYYRGQQMIECRDGSENVEQQYIFGTRYVDEPIRMDIDTDDDGDVLDSPGSAAYYHHQDANYNVTLLTDSTGNEAEFYQYSPYGQLSTFDANYRPLAQSAVNNPFTYTGRFHDVETGPILLPGEAPPPGLGAVLAARSTRDNPARCKRLSGRAQPL